MQTPKSFLSVVGSLWFAAVLLVLLMVAMGSATIYESAHGSEFALHVFYHSWWFRGLLALVAVNALAALASRFPFSSRHIGFLMTHGGILLILAGALATKYLSVGGRVVIPEGRTVSAFEIPQPVIVVVDRKSGARASIALDAGVFGGIEPAERPFTSELKIAGLTSMEIVRYLPDTIWHARMTDDGPAPKLAVHVTLGGEDDDVWLLADHTGTVGETEVQFRVVPSRAELAELVSGRAQTESKGRVRIEHAGRKTEIPLEECTSKAVAVKGTEFQVKVLRYLPHATVTGKNAVENASDKPVNPAIEVEVVGPSGKGKVLAFARFPDFSQSHGTMKDGPKITFIDAAIPAPSAPIELLSDPDGNLFVRFGAKDHPSTGRAIEVGKPVPTPWPGKTLTIKRRFTTARTSHVASLPAKITEQRTPAVLVKLEGGGQQREVWVAHGDSTSVTIGGEPFRLRFANKSVPLGFDVRLNRFHLRTYPGGRRPRSFESHITIVDAKTGGSQDRIVSMNNPTSHGGFTFYQSSYRQDERGNTTFLSVSRDPDQLIVFAGYFLTILGMFWVMVTKIREQRRLTRMQRDAAAAAAPHAMGA